MTRYICPSCHEVVESVPARFAFCTACGGPLTTEDVLPVQPIANGREQPERSAVPEAAA